MAEENRKRGDGLKLSRILLVLLLLLLGLVVVFRPDRPVATIAPGSSSGPSYVVQILRPRTGLPLGGLLPPQIFGVEANLGFDDQSAGAYTGIVAEGRLELGAEGWDLVIVLDGAGRVTSETQVTFALEFEDQLRLVRCRPDDPAVGSFVARALNESGELSGNFDIELARCEDAKTGKPLGWPPKPLVLHGSFDRLGPQAGAERK